MAHPRDENGLTAKQARFVEEFLVDMSKEGAAARAGYSRKTNLMKLKAVKAAVDRRLLEQKTHREINKEWLLEQLVENHSLARAYGELNNSNSSLKMVGQHVMVQGFVDKHVIGGDEKAPLQIAVKGELNFDALKKKRKKG